jgi:hypothetical protein
MKRFFVHTEDGTELYFTEEEARAAATEAIAEIRDECDEEWSDDVHSVFWGEVREEARQVRIGKDDHFIDYVLKPVVRCA